MNYQQFQAGQKVKNQYGEVLTVLFQRGCQVFIEEGRSIYYHPNNLKAYSI